ncbi:hypothetical protein [Alkalicoccobacillus plakortidis]|uniref:Uncharacterized protein n=1 Tax=Alkalicoccobacillus plakortidis TaxID=444060 RepID=A0ABT0XK21_9BACI|nr:hypothetical protein [Alkalicoccobacillus plakortidis]MCM2675567.1 hypothetical protein [Alkalicoccobacillus plakortidis]
MDVLPSDKPGSVRQVLWRNSANRDVVIYIRVVPAVGDPGDFVEIMTSGRKVWRRSTLINGTRNSPVNDPLMYASQAGLLFMKGRVDIPKGDPVDFARIPSELAPEFNWWVNCAVAGTTGDRKIVVRDNGILSASGLIANLPDNVTSVYVNLVMPMK